MVSASPMVGSFVSYEVSLPPAACLSSFWCSRVIKLRTKCCECSRKAFGRRHQLPPPQGAQLRIVKSVSAPKACDLVWSENGRQLTLRVTVVGDESLGKQPSRKIR